MIIKIKEPTLSAIHNATSEIMQNTNLNSNTRITVHLTPNHFMNIVWEIQMEGLETYTDKSKVGNGYQGTYNCVDFYCHEYASNTMQIEDNPPTKQKNLRGYGVYLDKPTLAAITETRQCMAKVDKEAQLLVCLTPRFYKALREAIDHDSIFAFQDDDDSLSFGYQGSWWDIKFEVYLNADNIMVFEDEQHTCSNVGCRLSDVQWKPVVGIDLAGIIAKTKPHSTVELQDGTTLYLEGNVIVKEESPRVTFEDGTVMFKTTIYPR